jgi:hypothetical protein
MRDSRAPRKIRTLRRIRYALKDLQKACGGGEFLSTYAALVLILFSQRAVADVVGRQYSPSDAVQDSSYTFPITSVGQTSGLCTSVCLCSDGNNCTCDRSGTIQLTHDLSAPFSAFNYRVQSANVSPDCFAGTSVSLPAFVDVGQMLSYNVEFSPTRVGTFSDDLGLNDYVLSVSGSTPRGEASLVPAPLSGWSAPLVVSTTPGTQIDSPNLTTADQLYLSWSIQNQGDLSTFGTFFIDVNLDGSLLNRWSWSDPLQPQWYLDLKDFPFGPLTAGSHTLELIPDPTGVIGATSSTYTKTITVRESGPPGTLSLVFPLKASAPNRDRHLGPYTAAVITVFDHSMAAGNGVFRPYLCDGKVVAFTGERGDNKPSPSGSACSDHPGYSQTDGQPFTITGHYVGSSPDGPAYLNYEGHPGFDYSARLGTQVFAAAGGTIHYPKGIKGAFPLQLSEPYNKYHVLEIIPDADPTYRIYYLHLSTHPSASGTKGTFSDPSPLQGCPAQVNLPLPEGAHVDAGCLVALSGKAGAVGAHLHFEVRKVQVEASGSVAKSSPMRCLADPELNDSSHACIPVDPYGWLGSFSDPYIALTGEASTYLWADARP